MTEHRPPLDADFLATLPPELRDLDRELSAIRIEERESFGPELEGELLRVWKRAPFEGSRPSGTWRRTLLAACAACLMIGGMAVPAARASVARLVRNVLEEAAPGLFPPVEEPRLPEILVADPETEVPPDATGDQSASGPLGGLDESAAQEEVASFSEVEYSYPEILFREEAEEIIASFYPTALQRAGIGGSVKLQLWVDASGRVDHIQMREGSGYQSLDLAAMRAATQLRYRPATRAGIPVGTWVEFTVNFVPGGQPDGVHPDPSPREGPGA